MNNRESISQYKIILLSLLAFIIYFSGLLRGAHDIWAATLVYVYFIVLGTLIFIHSPSSDKKLQFPLLFPSFILIGVFFLSYLKASNPSESYLELMDWVALLIMIFIAANTIKSDKEKILLLALISPFFLMELIVTIRQWLVIKSLVDRGLILYEEPIGTFQNGNSTIAFCLLWLPSLCRVGFDKHQAFFIRCLTWIGIFGITGVLLLISSYWSLVSLLVGFVFFLGKKPIKSLFKKYRVHFLTLMGLLFVVLSALAWYKLALIYGWSNVGSERVTVSRLIWWESGFAMWKFSPLLGIGLGNFSSCYLYFSPETQLNTLFSHSLIVQLFAETGVLGFIAFILFMVTFLLVIRPMESSISKSFFVGVVTFITFSLIQVSLEYLSHLIGLGLFIGILVASKKKFSYQWKPRPFIKIIMIIVSLGCLPYILSAFVASQSWVEGFIELENKQTEKAERLFQSAISLDDRPWEPYWGLAQISQSRGNAIEAMRYADMALSKNQYHLPLIKKVNGLKFEMNQISNEKKP